MDVRLFNDAPVGIALIGVAGDDSGRIVRANRAFGTLLASTPDELAGTSMCDLIHTDDRARAAAEFVRLIGQTGGSCEGEGRLLTSDGQTRWVRVHAGLLPTDGVARAVVMIHVIQIAELTTQPEPSAR
jgi:PAS domain S-box-containing protein